MMKKSIVAALMAVCLLIAAGASAENVVIRNADGTVRVLPGAKSSRVVVAAEEEKPAEQPKETAKEKTAREKAERAAAAEAAGFELTEEYRWFVSQYGAVRGRTVTYYDNVYAYNHGDYYLTPFDSKVSPEYLTIDEMMVGAGDGSGMIEMSEFELEKLGKKADYHERLKKSYYILQEHWKND